MSKMFDEDGNEYEIGVEPAKLAETLEGITQGQETLATKEKELLEAQEKLGKLENKDLNFKKLRDMSEDDKSKFTAAELEYKQQIEGLQDEISGVKSDQHKNIFEVQIKSIVGEDAELKEKVAKEYDKLESISATTNAEVADKLNKAFVIATGTAPNIDPLTSTVGRLGGIAPKIEATEELSDDVKSLGGKFGLTAEDFKPKQ